RLPRARPSFPTRRSSDLVDHGLHADSPHWATHCRKVADALDVPITVVPVHVDRGSGLGLEAAARAARHAVFEGHLVDGGIVALRSEEHTSELQSREKLVC